LLAPDASIFCSHDLSEPGHTLKSTHSVHTAVSSGKPEIGNLICRGILSMPRMALIITCFSPSRIPRHESRWSSPLSASIFSHPKSHQIAWHSHCPSVSARSSLAQKFDSRGTRSRRSRQLCASALQVFADTLVSEYIVQQQSVK
jgi:hypothetical protein